MKHLIVFSALAVTGCAAPSARLPGVLIPPDVMAACKAEGGCTLFSAEKLEQVLGEAFELGVAKGRSGRL